MRLRHDIDDRDKTSCQKASDNGIIDQLPAERKVDDIILAFALENLNTKMVASDTFSDYLKEAGYRGDLRLINHVLAKRGRFVRLKSLVAFS